MCTIVATYQQSIGQVYKACDLLADAEDALNAVVTLDNVHKVHTTDVFGKLDVRRPETAVSQMRRVIWRSLIERLELRRMMTNARWEALRRQVDADELPDITEANVHQVFSGFITALPAMLTESVEEVFNWLRPRRSTYKTNSEFEVPSKVVLKRIVEQWGPYQTSWRVNYHEEQYLTALENVFGALDGRGQVNPHHWSALHNLINAKDFDGVGETDMFKIRVFKNGNGHLWFKRLDLLAKFNALAGGNRLRAKTE